MRTSQRTAFAGGTVKHATVPVRNTGVHAGNLDVFAWGRSDQNANQGSMDMRDAGVQAFSADFCGVAPDANDRCLIFAVNTWQPWSSEAENEFDVLIDINHDGTEDFAVVGIDYLRAFGRMTISRPSRCRSFWTCEGPRSA